MKTESTKLVAIEEETLETVAGGYGYYAAPSFDLKKFKLDLDYDFNQQANDIVVAGNNVVSGPGGSAAIVIEATNFNG
ncbi:MAG: hypothetical protein OXU20_02610 [Myxococcales bacterium]|nr:hypothetical protein [Myxococcales bacterium]MDD9967577.1 hypothetical protein [Myxococcales bacterium]